ncbi:hypothetical protein [Janibacter sp. GXQ6167]|uniref:hypothetical protein n=1 Tax=Janibacter sp. GXQ6167 TaxID=3240791 RepID=UPI00352414F8
MSVTWAGDRGVADDDGAPEVLDEVAEDGGSDVAGELGSVGPVVERSAGGGAGSLAHPLTPIAARASMVTARVERRGRWRSVEARRRG